MPVYFNDIFSLTLKSGNGTADGDPYDAPSNLLHVIHVPIFFLTASNVLLSNIDFFIHKCFFNAVVIYIAVVILNHQFSDVMIFG